MPEDEQVKFAANTIRENLKGLVGKPLDKGSVAKIRTELVKYAASLLNAIGAQEGRIIVVKKGDEYVVEYSSEDY